MNTQAPTYARTRLSAAVASALLLAPLAAQANCPGGADPLYWVAPMDADFRRDAPGKSPMGMDLVPECPGGDSGSDVTVPANVQQSLGLRTATAQRETLTSRVRALGVVDWNADSLTMVHARAEGWLEDVGPAVAGAHVADGDPLYTLFSPKLVAAEREYLAASAGLKRAAAERLRALGYSTAQIRTLARRGTASEQTSTQAPGDAVVTMLGVRPGEYVAPGTHLMTLADPDTMWVWLDVPAKHAGRIHAGQAVTLTVEDAPGRTWTSRVAAVYPELNPRTRTLRVQLAVDNADGALRAEQFAAAVIEIAPIADVLSVPASAVIRRGDGARVVRVASETGFDIVPVELGRVAGDRAQILSGLSAGDRVVTAGQFLIDAEANVSAEALRVAHNDHAMTPHETGKVGTATGTVVAIDAGKNTLTLDHGPFAPQGNQGLSMPAMTMGFSLSSAVSLDGIRAGDTVNVTVENPSRGVYRIVNISQANGGMQHEGMEHESMDHGSTGGGSMDHDSMNHDAMDHGSMDHGAMDHGTIKASGMTRGTIVAVNAKTRLLVIDHETIANLKMGAMTMGFQVADNVELGGLSAGDAVMFSADNPSQGVFRVTALKPAQ